MFGMDARVALIVAAILTAAGGLTIMSKLERAKVDQAEIGIETLREALLKYYAHEGINKMPDSLEVLFQNGLVTDPALRKDPWGNPWYFQTFSSNVSLEGTLVSVQFAVIFSGGKDGVSNSPNLSGETDFAEWEPMKDDVGVKISTRDIELKRKEEYIARAQLIIDKMEAVESTAYMEAQNACSAPNPPTWCSGTGGKNYTQFNFYPRSNLDTTSGVIYYGVDVLGRNMYQSGNEDDMQQFLSDLGLPTSYVKDPWGRVLNFHSNVTGRSDPPFSASVCFAAEGEDCFSRQGGSASGSGQ